MTRPLTSMYFLHVIDPAKSESQFSRSSMIIHSEMNDFYEPMEYSQNAENNVTQNAEGIDVTATNTTTIAEVNSPESSESQ